MSIDNQLPDFIVIGASKSGTSSIHNYLKEHNEVFMPDEKETNFFAYSDDVNETKFLKNYQVKSFHAKTLEEYKALFSNAGNEKVCGEASPVYLSSPLSAKKIKSIIPDSKIIVSLRNPVERALSSYSMHSRLGGEKRTPQEVFANLDEEAYVLSGQYYKLLSKYYDLFDRDKIYVQLFEHFKASPIEKMQDIYRFIEVNDEFIPCTDKIHKKGGVPSSSLAQTVDASVKFISSSRMGKVVKTFLPSQFKRSIRDSIESCYLHYPEYDQELKERLRDFYLRDNEKLAQLVEIDLSVWS